MLMDSVMELGVYADFDLGFLVPTMLVKNSGL